MSIVRAPRIAPKRDVPRGKPDLRISEVSIPPVTLAVFLAIHAGFHQPVGSGTSAYLDSVRWLLGNQLIVDNSDNSDPMEDYELTERGRAWLAMLTKGGLPVAVTTWQRPSLPPTLEA